MDNTIHSDLIRGHINTIILKSLFEGDKYGYEICKVIADKSVGQYTLKQPTLYSSLKRLEAQGCIKSYWGTAQTNGGRRRYYTLTDMGRDIYLKSQAEWEYSRTIIDQLISDKIATAPLQFQAAGHAILSNKQDEEEEEELDEEEEEEDKEKPMQPIAPSLSKQPAEPTRPAASETKESSPSQEPAAQKRSALDAFNHPDKKSYADSVLSGEADSAHSSAVRTEQPAYPSFEDSALMTEKEFKSELSKLLLLTRTHILSEGIYSNTVEKPHVIDTAERKPKKDESVLQFESKLEKPISDDEPTFNEIRYKLQADGFKIRTRTDRQPVKKADVSDYIDAGKIILHTMLITFLFVLAELCVIYFAFNSTFGLNLKTFIIICSCSVALPMFGILYNAHMKNKRVYDKYKFSYSFVITLILTIIAVSITSAIALLGGVILSETQPLMQRIILPSVISFNMILGSVIYFVLYKSKRYFV